MNSCIEICDQPDKWSPSTVIYNDVFVPIYNKTAPQKGHYADLRLQLPPIQAGEAVIQVAHQFKEGGVSRHSSACLRRAADAGFLGRPLRRLRLHQGPRLRRPVNGSMIPFTTSLRPAETLVDHHEVAPLAHAAAKDF